MTLNDIINDAINLEIDARGTAHHKDYKHLRDALEAYKHELFKTTPEPEAEWVTLETDESSFGFQKCCDTFLSEIEQRVCFAPYDHSSGTRPFIGVTKVSHNWELHYCPYCGVKINLQYELTY